ncbi:hypothetical protein [Alicyclobacillus sp. SO9]|uniref:hypothetical protein n=1 Tax=Alicyclobacillus sp. SO9 TaxID=2665646 RepID=UPI0018E7D109|nr:hypothetical protein [Alicyclobacillus sp. SO9]QQE80323.1 hypothetical protein GI364_07845 [Alicyclobacillus sp. SO9]
MYSNEWFYEMERRFALEQFDDDSGFRIEQGVIPVIVSASHAVSQWREDKIKRGEFRTGPISLWLHQTTNCHAIYKTKNKMDDANFDKRSTYRDALIQHIQANSVQYLLDLHMMHPSRHSGIDIGTANGRNTHSDPQALS